MKTVQLIKVTETTLYYKNGEVINQQLTPIEKLHISVYGKTKQLRTEEVVERWNVKTKREADKRFWDFVEENKVESGDYYLIFDF
jgi:hypothetical protein